MQKTIYLYHITNKKMVQNIQFAAIRLGCKAKKITEEMAGQKVGYIADLEGFEEEVNDQAFEIPTEPVLLLKGFNSKTLDELLARLRTAGVPKSVLKAMLNENNQNWYFYDLCKELKREHEEFNK